MSCEMHVILCKYLKGNVQRVVSSALSCKKEKGRVFGSRVLLCYAHSYTKNRIGHYFDLLNKQDFAMHLFHFEKLSRPLQLEYLKPSNAPKEIYNFILKSLLHVSALLCHLQGE
jgi:hypothetical protein